MATKWQLVRARLAEPYRVTVQKEETFEATGTYQVNYANLLFLGLTALGVVALLTFALVALTPLRRLVPGYGVADERAEVIALNNALREIQKRVNAQEAYTANVRDVLVGDIEPPEVEDVEMGSFPDSALNVDRIPEDERLRADVSASARRTDAEVAGDLDLENIDFSAPLEGSISSTFDPADRHFGIDVTAPAETEVRAVLDGYVVSADFTRATGNVIALQHAGNLITLYKHNASLLKRIGDHVSAGDPIAIVGNTGTRTDGPHLHFEIWHRGRPVDPVAFVPFD